MLEGNSTTCQRLLISLPAITNKWYALTFAISPTNREAFLPTAPKSTKIVVSRPPAHEAALLLLGATLRSQTECSFRYHGEHGTRTLKELARSYITTRDLTRVVNRLKAIYRSWGIPCAGKQVYAPRYRAEWPAKVSEAGVRRRAELYFQKFDALAALRQGARRELLAEARKHLTMRLLRQIPSIGRIRAALLIALMQTPNRFRTKRQLWAYCGLALRTYTSGEYRFVAGQLKRSRKVLAVRG